MSWLWRISFVALSAGLSILCSGCGSGDTGGGPVATSASERALIREAADLPPPVGTGYVYRFAKISNGAYFYTGNQAERDLVIASYPDFRYEGTAFLQQIAGASTQVYRFANLTNGGYFYTANAGERDFVMQTRSDLRFEGTTFSVAPPTTAGGIPVYRLANLRNGAYLYTAQSAERDYAVRLGIWRDEGVAFTAPSVSSANAAPVANAGAGQNVTAGTVATLNGRASSDANGDPLTYAWTLISKPAGSAAVLASAASATPTFTADVAGIYVASLIVNDGKVSSTSSNVTIAATAPAPPAGITYTISGAVSGLGSGKHVTLLNNSGNATIISTNGGFSFSTPVSRNESYAVTVGTQPIGQTCVVNSGSGLSTVSNVSNVQVTCSSFGMITTKVGVSGGHARAVAIQPDGKIVVAGNSATSTRDSDFGVLRFNPNGSLDTSFGGTGVVITNLYGRVASTDWARGIAIQNDGKIIVAGYTERSGDARAGLALVRYNLDGSLDTSFSGSGIVKSLDPFKNKMGHAVAIQPDGKILIAGAVNCTNPFTAGYCTLLERYNTDGSVDWSFSGPDASRRDESTTGASGLVLQSDGKILVVGSKDNGNGYELSVARYKTDGLIDSSFGNSGVSTVTIGSEVGASNYGSSIALNLDGSILVARVASSPSTNNHISLTRLLPNGSVDVSFGRLGSVVTNVATPPESDFSNGIAVQSDGRIVIVGESTTARPKSTQVFPGFYSSSNVDFAVVRYTATGNLDSSFGGTGIVISDMNLLSDRCHALALQPNGSIVLVGETYIYDPLDTFYGGHNSFGVMRFRADGTLDPTFAPAN